MVDAEEEPQWPDDTVGICACGLPLTPVFDENGKRIGVTHTYGPPGHHEEFFSGMRVELPE